MVDTIFSLLENALVNYTVAGIVPERNGNIDPSIAPFDVYECKDGFVAVGVGNDRLFEKFCKTINHEELLEDPRFTTNDLRCKNYVPDLQNLIGEWCKDYTKKEMEEIMDKAGIPCGPILNVKEAIEHPHIQAREMMVHCEHPTAGDQYFQGCVMKLSETPGSVDTPAVKEAIEHPHIQAREMMVHCEHPTAGDQYFQGCVMKLSETPGSVDTPAPLLGQHNAEVFGLTEDEEKELRAQGVI